MRKSFDFKMGLLPVIIATTALLSTYSNAEVFYPAAVGLMTCKTGDGLVCDDETMDFSDFKMIVTLAAGYQDQTTFETEAEYLRLDTTASDTIERNGVTIDNPLWSNRYKERLMYITYWEHGGIVAYPDANYGATIYQDPLRLDFFAGISLKSDSGLVDAKADELKVLCPGLAPVTVNVLFEIPDDWLVGGTPGATVPVSSNAQLPTTARPPYEVRRHYGLSNIANNSLGFGYIGQHEMGHSVIGWIDEYSEGALTLLSATDFDIFTPLFIFDQGIDVVLLSTLGIYPMRVSQIMMSNGVDNISTVPYPGRVDAPAGVQGSEDYLREGAFFARGVFQYDEVDENDQVVDNIMLGRSHTHSPPQIRVIEHAFGETTARANDRIVNAGPPGGFIFSGSADYDIMIYDEDKNHTFHPTTQYDVEVQWSQIVIVTCRMPSWPYWSYLCFDTVDLSVTKSFTPTESLTTLDHNVLTPVGEALLTFFCDITDDSFEILGLGFCETEADELIESLFHSGGSYLPYQRVSIPTPLPLTGYRWRVRTYNGEVYSGWTNQSGLNRFL
ncbi:MAG: hypothetical protein COB51_09420 [Moraxellaceae bacterium]|nr:MAG: hypothetical protein COB51_09420 [Moraxellaceae bacterium]